MSDLEKWANSTNDELYEIAKDWAVKWDTCRLRGFQEHYNYLLKHKRSEIDALGLQNMWQCATFAISIREFGE